MSSTTETLAARYERTVASLRGKRITQVAYHPLLGGDVEDGAVEDWDFGAWHQPTMGVVFALDDGSSALATWNSRFAHYGLEVTVSPRRDGLRDIGPAGAPGEVDVSRHPRWAGLLAAPLSAVQICWEQFPLSDDHWPVAVRWEAAGACVWTAVGAPAAWPFDGRFQLSTDDVLVIFEHGLAARAGIPGTMRLPLQRRRERPAT